MRNQRLGILGTLAVVGILQSGFLTANALEIAPPTQVGLSPQRLTEITTLIEKEIQARRIAGAVVAIARHGRLAHLQAVGHRDHEAQLPMQRDTIFRIASMTKAITSAGIMQLHEEGLLALDDPVDKYLPEFATPRVLRGSDGSTTSTYESDRAPTIHELLTHTSGLTYGWFGPPNLDQVYTQHQVSDFFLPTTESTAERVNRIAKVPLKFQPGTQWEYGVSIDVLGRVIEVVSGLTLDQYFRERFFRPLKMGDSHFYLPADKVPRLAALYTPNEQLQIRRVTDRPTVAGFLTFTSNYCLASDSEFFSGGAGLVSTATDYLRFLQMLLNGGQLDGVRVLQSATVRRMTENQIGNLRIPFPGHGDGFGYGFGVKTDRGSSSDEASVGSYSWGGIFNTYFWVDPQEQLIGVLMTQLFPYDHLSLRDDFRRLTYAAIDDSGFRRIYWYEQGVEHANPHFNPRQLRVNAPEASIHPTFADRSEPKSSGLARILMSEDLRHVRRVDMYAEIWGGHPGTGGKRVSINGRSTHLFPEVGTADQHCTHQYVSFNLRPRDLVNGYNSLQFACDQGDTFWGHYIVDNVALVVGLRPEDAQLLGMDFGDLAVRAQRTADGECLGFELQATPKQLALISAVHYQGKYFGFDENGNGWCTDWHGMTKERKPYGMLGTATEAPFHVVWDTSMLPTQERVAVRAFVELKDHPNTVYLTAPLTDLAIRRPDDQQVTLHDARNLPTRFWSRANRAVECSIDLNVDPANIEAAELHVVTWTGGAGSVRDYFTLNGRHFPVAEGDDHAVVYSRLPVKPDSLRRGANKLVLQSDTQHHGIEVLRPGPTLVVRHRADTQVRLIESARDESAGGLDCYKIETPRAVFYLDKVGAGLSSMIDRDGNDWLSFRPDPGTGAGGEYRGFPNAVFKEEGSYFHPRNAGTDPCVTVVEHVAADRVVISALSSNGKWAGRYEFTADGCVFTLTKRPRGRKYWVLYEGTPGGAYDDDDWWMTSASPAKHSLLTPHVGDIDGPEWIAFGDKRAERVLFVAHLNDDLHPDRFYQMQKKMTVFGFGRDGMQKFLDSVPQSFAIGILETTEHDVVDQEIAKMETRWSQRHLKSEIQDDSQVTRRMALEQFALITAGDARRGRELFFNDQRTRCSTCHRANQSGGEVGPDLSAIGGKFDRPHLIESLLEPSRQIVEGYRTSVIVTDDGIARTGVIRLQDADTITLFDAAANPHKIRREQIEEQVETSVSIMPEGMADTLSPQDFANLIAFLETLRTGKAKFGADVSGPVQLADGFEITTVATGITGATALETLRDGRILICEQPGALRVVKHGELLDEPFLTLSVDDHWERGLIGVTVAPDFPAEPLVYIVYVADKPFPHHRISRFRAAEDAAIPGSEVILLRGDDQRTLGGHVPAGHQGGGIHFGTDGKLYVGIGEQTANLPAQKLDTFQGKLLRINPDGTIPADNPFVDQATDKYRAIWAIGCRNPFTFAVQESTGMMLINDVGGKHEEINRGVAGANYGWPVVDHGPTDQPGIESPVYHYPQASIAGGDFAEKDLAWPNQYLGRYFFADFVHGWIKTLDPETGNVQEFASGLRRPVDLRFSRDGSLYVLLRNAWVNDDKFAGGTGSLLRIRPKDG